MTMTESRADSGEATAAVATESDDEIVDPEPAPQADGAFDEPVGAKGEGAHGEDEEEDVAGHRNR